MLASLHGIMIDQDIYEKIVNFAADTRLENVPIRQNMFYPLRISEELEDKVAMFNNTTYRVLNLELHAVPAISGKGTALIAIGDCPPLLELREEMAEDSNLEEEEPEFVEIVICEDFDGDEDRVEFLNAKFTDYIESANLTEFFTRYLNIDDIYDYVLDGRVINS